MVPKIQPRTALVAPAPLTPDQRISRARKLIAEGIDEMIEARLARTAEAAEWVSQKTSPLGRKRHLALVRAGKLPGVREGQLVLVRRVDLEAYLDAHRVLHPRVERDDDVDAMVEAIVSGARQ